jgi:hypothetical protein
LASQKGVVNFIEIVNSIYKLADSSKETENILSTLRIHDLEKVCGVYVTIVTINMKLSPEYFI